MPVQEAIPYSEAIGNGVSKSFALGFPCEKKEYLIVKVGDVQTSEWSLSNNTVTFTTAPELNAFIQFKRETKIERTTDYATYNDSLRGEVLNKDFDKVYEILQENKSDTTQYKPDYEYSVAKANEAHQIASEAYNLAELTKIKHGGTGADNAEDARENLGVYDKAKVDALIATGGASNVVPIAGGGTSADNAEDARENLGIYSKNEIDNNFLNKTKGGAIEGELSVLSLYSYGDITAFSDNRIKDNIENIENALSKVNGINGVTYTRSDMEDKNSRHVGLIAQEVLVVCPEAVCKIKDERGTLTVNYQGLIGLLVEAIKELDKKVKALGGE